MKSLFRLLITCLLITTPPSAFAKDIEFSGKLALEAQWFEKAGNTEQQDLLGSVKFEPKVFYPINQNSEIRAKGYYRYDAQSPSRTHGDIRELMYYHFADNWELRAGIGKVFWGTTETRHLVDTINQIDLIESLDDEQRLGQAMLQARFFKDWGTVDLFVLPGFREQDFGQQDLRPAINTLKPALYQSSDKTNHLDFAARWSHYYDELDIGLSYFNGTQRNPLLKPQLVGSEIKFQPVYVQTQQFGLDGQYIIKDWLLKLEALWRLSHDYSSTQGFHAYDSKALVSGFEYTFYGINQQAHDLGVIGEYLYDEWSDSTLFQHDWMSGIRWVWNDAAGTEFLLAHIFDLDEQSQLWQLKASRRLQDDWNIEANVRWVSEAGAKDNLAKLYQPHNIINIELSYFF